MSQTEIQRPAKIPLAVVGSKLAGDQTALGQPKVDGLRVVAIGSSALEFLQGARGVPKRNQWSDDAERQDELPKAGQQQQHAAQQEKQGHRDQGDDLGRESPDAGGRW